MGDKDPSDLAGIGARIGTAMGAGTGIGTGCGGTGVIGVSAGTDGAGCGEIGERLEAGAEGIAGV